MIVCKSELAAVLGAIGGGIFGILGIGHIYSSKVAVGLLLMLFGFVLNFTTLVLFIDFFSAIAKHLNPQPWWLLLSAVYLAIYVWQIFDARAVCREYNRKLMQNPYALPYPPYPPPQWQGRM